MSRDAANMSIDFLAGFTIFLVAFVWVVSMVPGLLVGLQAFTIDYDAVAYRTGVILVEDPGANDYNASSWEVARQGTDYAPSVVERFGLAVSRETPNILSLDKVNRFFDSTTFNQSNYHDKAIFGDYPYHFNIRFQYVNSTHTDTEEIDHFQNLTVGESVPLNASFGYIRRFVKVKTMSNMTVDGSETVGTVNRLYYEKYVQGDNKTRTHIVSVLLDNNNLTGRSSGIKNPSFQIFPAQESLLVNFTFLDNTMWNSTDNKTYLKMDRCYDIMIDDQNITVSDGSPPLIYIRNATIDETPVHLAGLTRVAHNLSIILNTTIDPERRGIDWDSDRITLDMKFTLVPSSTNGDLALCPCSLSGPTPWLCTGSTFLNSTLKSLSDHPFEYYYNTSYKPERVTIPRLRDGMLEVAIW